MFLSAQRHWRCAFGFHKRGSFLGLEYMLLQKEKAAIRYQEVSLSRRKYFNYQIY